MHIEIIIEERQGTIKLLYEPNKDIISVQADKGRIIQVISNLLSNAIKFTKEGTISILLYKGNKDNQVVIVSVKDTGPG